MREYEIVVAGGGHAGVEAALAAARLGHKTLMLCLDLGTISMMACNPSIGGTAKGHLVREIDALGGQMGIVADASLVQIKMLNRAKGPAVFSLRGQQDKAVYQQKMLDVLMSEPNLTVEVGEFAGIKVANSDSLKNTEEDKTKTEHIKQKKSNEVAKVEGVLLASGEEIRTKAVIIATGVYLNGRVIIGEYVMSSGPSGYAPATHLTDNLIELGLPMRRFKTGTPARIYRDSIDFDEMEIQKGEDVDRFSFLSDRAVFEEEPCYLTYTNQQTHDIIKTNIHRSPLYNGNIKGVGPRYCPSIEDKVMRFADKDRHQIFVEPEGLHSDEMYIQGMSSSLPHDVQEAMYRTLPGLKNCRFAKYAYAIEYDCIDPLSLYPTLEHMDIGGLYFAGQMNGSSGYEEAAAQGLMAGVNASLKLCGKKPFILKRDEAYIGVLIDDLVTKGTNEPYRMMTARAEHRIKLRQDNADMRLTEKGREIGLVTDERYNKMLAKKAEIEAILAMANKRADSAKVSQIFERIGEPMPQKAPTIGDVAKRPATTADDLKYLLAPAPDPNNETKIELNNALLEDEAGIAAKNDVCTDECAEQSHNIIFSDEAVSAALIEMKYDGYLKKQEIAIREQKRLEERELPDDLDYSEIKGLRIEARQKLAKVRPLNLGQASRISGVSPADIAVLIVYLNKTR